MGLGGTLAGFGARLDEALQEIAHVRVLPQGPRLVQRLLPYQFGGRRGAGRRSQVLGVSDVVP